MHDLSNQEVPVSDQHDIGKCLYGTVTVGERGQIVIPADARRDLSIGPGDKLIMIKHPVCGALMIGKLDCIIGFFDGFTQRLKNAEPTDGEEDR